MRGRQIFMDSLLAHGVDKIFGNPGTTENPLLDSLLDYPDIDYIVHLHEGVAASAASFYAQAANKPTVLNLHVAPGLGNGIGGIYGALKARSPVVVTAGQQDTRMRMRSPLLSHDLVAMAAPVTKWSAQPASADEMAPLMQRAFRIACEPPMGPVFVALPIDVMEQESEIRAGTFGRAFDAVTPDPRGVSDLCALRAAARSPAIVAGDEVARGGAFHGLVALAERIGAPVFNEPLRAQLPFPNRHASYVGRLPLEAASMRRALADHDLVLVIGGAQFDEVWFDEGDPFPDGAKRVQIERVRSDIGQDYAVDLGLYGDLAQTLGLVLEGLEEQAMSGVAERNAALAARRAGLDEQAEVSLARVHDAVPMAPARALAEIAAALPPGATVVDETITASVELARVFDFSQPGDYYGGRGGGIGQGIAGALGVQVAHPDRPVLALSGDGSAMYSIQALWTAAHHDLPIVFVILSNREYRVLKHNMDIYRARFQTHSNKPYPNMDLTNPTLGFVDIAAGYGIEGVQVTEASELGDAVRRAFASGKPALIDVVVSGKEYGMD
ncbi:MAG: thiamine pyrophosphate-binding protein [Pseudomonadota bacterium]